MSFFTFKLERLYEREIDGYKKYIELQNGIIAQKEQELSQLKFENIQLKEQLRAAQESQQPQQELEPIFTRNEPWTLRKQRLERDDARTSNAQSQYLEEYWKKRNEELNAREERNA